MKAFDYWTDELAYDEIGIKEVDENAERAALFKQIRDNIKSLPFDHQIAIGKKMYKDFMETFERATRMIEKGQSKGLSFTQILDEHLGTSRM